MRWALAAWVLPAAAILAACQADREVPQEELGQAWTWMSGSDARYQAGVYGTKGVEAPSNVPGSRHMAASWADPGGKLWLFGGDGMDSTGMFSILNDLWRFDPTTASWTWKSGSHRSGQAGSYGTKGVASPTNVPGARYSAVTWTDSGGRLWLFGGIGIGSGEEGGELNDLWRFDPATLEWTWISGSDSPFQQGVYGTKGVAASGNVPGARSDAVSWADSEGRLWLFGGFGYAATLPYNVDLNDLWMFDPAALMWTWVSGGDAGNERGVYGTRGQADPANVPGARGESVSWIDAQGKLWIFGGWGWDSSFDDVAVQLNDLWCFDPVIFQWTWITGGSAGAQAGLYGAKGFAAPGNTPGSRLSASAWRDPQGKFWLFGGFGNNSAGLECNLNDLWRFDPSTFEWAWISGSDLGDQASAYGTKGEAAISNVPGSRGSAVSWVGLQGTLWLFGGSGMDPDGEWGLLNDLWRYRR